MIAARSALRSEHVAHDAVRDDFAVGQLSRVGVANASVVGPIGSGRATAGGERHEKR